jgi:hypothetical protein
LNDRRGSPACHPPNQHLQHTAEQVVVQLGGTHDVPHGENRVAAQQAQDESEYQCQVAQKI